MFKDEHQMWKKIVLNVCIETPHTKTCYTFMHTHIKVIKFKGHFYFKHTVLQDYNPTTIFRFLKYVIIIESIIRHSVKNTVPTKFKTKNSDETTLVNGINSRRYSTIINQSCTFQLPTIESRCIIIFC